MALSITPAQTAAWRKQILEQLSERTKREMDNFSHYEQAIEQVRGAIFLRGFRFLESMHTHYSQLSVLIHVASLICHHCSRCG